MSRLYPEPPAAAIHRSRSNVSCNSGLPPARRRCAPHSRLYSWDSLGRRTRAVRARGANLPPRTTARLAGALFAWRPHMYSKVKLSGHPLHPMLVGLPVTFYLVTLASFGAYAL